MQEAGAFAVGWADDPDAQDTAVELRALMFTRNVGPDGDVISSTQVVTTTEIQRDDVRAVHPDASAQTGFDQVLVKANYDIHVNVACAWATNSGAGSGEKTLLGCLSFSRWPPH